MSYHFTWLIWAMAFLLPWSGLYFAYRPLRSLMWRASFATALLGLTEPIFVPRYWNPPTLFELAQRTGFDVESLIFSFAIGGIGCALYVALMNRDLVPIAAAERHATHHMLHRLSLTLPFVLFVPLYFLPWNPIYPSLLSLFVGAVAAVVCRPDLARNTAIGGLLFMGLYAIFMIGLLIAAPGYIERVWNLRALSGGLVAGIPLEELIFGLVFGLYWAGVYEHVAWTATAVRGSHPDRLAPDRPSGLASLRRKGQAPR